ncbi:hypothetical protein WJX82_004304 [Trebouxia sp. C0006]
MASLLTLQLVCCCLTVEVLNQPREPACEASEQASNTNSSKGPGAQGSGSSAARGCSTTPSAACDVTPLRAHASNSAATSEKGFPL